MRTSKYCNHLEKNMTSLTLQHIKCFCSLLIQIAKIRESITADKSCDRMRHC